MSKFSESGLQRHGVTDVHFPGRENRRVDTRALSVLLNNAPQNGGVRLTARRVERNHHATLVHLRNCDPCCSTHAKSPSDPVQLIEGFAAVQINEHIRAKTPNVIFDSAFLSDAGNRLAADE
jgi:hypothetical protein